jgi:hypothetical protein
MTKRGQAGKFTRWQSPVIPISVGAEKDRRFDEFVERGEGPNRYRIYRLRGGELELVATAPTAEAMGLALTMLAREGEFIVDDSVGVLDTATDPGHWIVNPFTLGRRRPDE